VEGRKNKGWKWGRKMLNEPLYCMPDKELSDQSSVQSYHIPCEAALMGLTTTFQLSMWAA